MAKYYNPPTDSPKENYDIIKSQQDYINNKKLSQYQPVMPSTKDYGSILADNRTEEINSTVNKYYKQYGSNTVEVKKLQEMLNKGGYYDNKDVKNVDGKFGDLTKAAYEKYVTNPFAQIQDRTTKTYSSKECATYVSNELGKLSDIKYTGVYGDAWTMLDNIKRRGGTVKYNIYDNPSFKGITGEAKLKSNTEAIKKVNKASADMFQLGDVVGIYNSGSPYHKDALKEGKGTYNTHVGYVSGFEEINGVKVPIISSNDKGKLIHQKYNTTKIGWIASPKYSNLNMNLGKYDMPKFSSIKSNISKNVDNLSQVFKSDVDKQWLKQTVYGIARLETNLGKLSPSKDSIEKTQKHRKLLNKSYELGDISQGIGKIKLNTIPKEVLNYLNVNTDNINKPEYGIAAMTYKIIEAYDYFKDMKNKNPHLRLDENDIRNLAILSYNQGFKGKLSTIGYNTKLPLDEEISNVRKLYSGNIKDKSSTKYKYLPGKIGDIGYGLEFPKGHETYISRVNKYAKNYNLW